MRRGHRRQLYRGRASCLSSVAVVTPFRRQAVLTRNHVQRLLPGTTDIPIIDMVERVQGLTVDLIVISMCSTDPEYISARASCLLSPNHLNVALSRARCRAILFAPREILETAPDDYDALLAVGLWRRLLQACAPMTLAHLPNAAS